MLVGRHEKQLAHLRLNRSNLSIKRVYPTGAVESVNTSMYITFELLRKHGTNVCSAASTEALALKLKKKIILKKLTF